MKIKKIICFFAGHKFKKKDSIDLTYKPGNKIPGYFGRVTENRSKSVCSCCGEIKIESNIAEVDSYYDN